MKNHWVVKLMIVLAFAAGVLSGCTKIEEYRSPHAIPGPGGEVGGIEEPPANDADEPKARRVIVWKQCAADNALAFLASFRELSATEQEKELARLTSAAQPGGSFADRLQLALLLSQPGYTFTDQEKALRLLGLNKAEDPADQGLEGLAELLIDLLNRQQELQQQLAEETQRSEGLAQQLNDLRDIENIIRQREMNSLPGQ